MIFWPAAAVFREQPLATRGNRIGDAIRHLLSDGLVGAFSFYDAQMDDFALGQWVIEQSRQLGVEVRSRSQNQHAGRFGRLRPHCQCHRPLGHAAAPATRRTACLSPRLGARQPHFYRPAAAASVDAAIPGEKRIFFVLPYQGKTLIGTTEVRENTPEAEPPSPQEIDYLLAAYNAYHCDALGASDVSGMFSGVRPLLKSAANPSNATREMGI